MISGEERDDQLEPGKRGTFVQGPEKAKTRIGSN